MRCVKEDYFFAPRPKLSGAQRIIRCLAIYLGTCVAAVFAFFYFNTCAYLWGGQQTIFFDFTTFRVNLWGDQQTIFLDFKTFGVKTWRAPLAVKILLMVLVEILLLIPLWRLYELRRWASVVLILILIVTALLCFFLVVTGVALAFTPLIFALIAWYVLSQELPNLKPGF